MKNNALSCNKPPTKTFFGFRQAFLHNPENVCMAWGRIPVQKNKQPNNENMQKWWIKKETLRLPDFIILMVRPSVITLTLSKFNVSFVVHVCFLVGTSCWSITLMLLLFYRAMIFKGEISCWSFSLPCGPEFRFLRRVMTISFRLKTHVLSITSQVWTLFPVEWDGFNLYTFTKDDTYNKTLDPFQLCWLTGSPRTLQVISLRDHNLSLQCRRILGGRNLVRVRNIVVAAIFDFMTVEDWGE